MAAAARRPPPRTTGSLQNESLCFQAAHFGRLPFVLEPRSQQACKIDELAHGLFRGPVLGGSDGVEGGGGCGASMSGDPVTKTDTQRIR